MFYCFKIKNSAWILFSLHALVKALACKIAFRPVKIILTSQQNLSKNFQKMSPMPVDIKVYLKDILGFIFNFSP